MLGRADPRSAATRRLTDTAADSSTLHLGENASRVTMSSSTRMTRHPAPTEQPSHACCSQCQTRDSRRTALVTCDTGGTCSDGSSKEDPAGRRYPVDTANSAVPALLVDVLVFFVITLDAVVVNVAADDQT